MIEADWLAKRYGVRPSEFLKSDSFEFLFDLFAAQCGVEEEKRQQRHLGASRGR